MLGFLIFIFICALIAALVKQGANFGTCPRCHSRNLGAATDNIKGTTLIGGRSRVCLNCGKRF